MMIELLLTAIIVWAGFSFKDASFLHLRAGRDALSTGEQLTFLVRYMRARGLTPEQLAEAWAQTPVVADVSPVKRTSGEIASKVLFFLGAIFVFAGIGVYTATFWSTMSSFMRIFVTLGVGIGLSLLSVLAMKEGKYEKAILPLIIMAAFFECTGWFVLMNELFPHMGDTRKADLVAFSLMALQHALVFHLFRRDLLAFATILFGYGALQVALDLAGVRDEYIAVLLGASLIYTAHIMERTPQRALCPLLYIFAGAWFNAGVFASVQQAVLPFADAVYADAVAAIVTAISLFSLAYMMERASHVALTTFLYLVGGFALNTGIYVLVEMQSSEAIAFIITGASVFSLGYGLRFIGQDKLSGLGFFVGSALFYAGLFDEVRHTPLELIYFAVSVAMLYGSAILHSRALLATSVLAMLGFIGYYTNEYFLNSVGWPIALIIMGLAFLGVGWIAIGIKRKYHM